MASSLTFLWFALVLKTSNALQIMQACRHFLFSLPYNKKDFYIIYLPFSCLFPRICFLDGWKGMMPDLALLQTFLKRTCALECSELNFMTNFVLPFLICYIT